MANLKPNCNRGHISQIECGVKNAGIESFEKIAKALNVPLSELFEKLGGDESTDANYPLLCYELVASRSLKEQKQIYKFFMEIEKYKDI